MRKYATTFYYFQKTEIRIFSQHKTALSHCLFNYLFCLCNQFAHKYSVYGLKKVRSILIQIKRVSWTSFHWPEEDTGNAAAV
jgi:hypothetical protein